jgi:hypothetical protein
MASRASLIQSRSIYVGTSNAVAPSDGNLIVTGNVGIGTTAPGAPLSVAGAGGSTKGTNGYIVHIGGTDGNVDPVRYMIGFSHDNTYTAANVRAALGMMVTTGGAGNLVFETGLGGAGQLERMRINGDGNVGIGTTEPAKKLVVQSSSQTWASAPQIAFYDTETAQTDSRNWTIGAISTNWGSLNIASSTAAGGDPTTPRFTITKDGNVGIGTTAPNLSGGSSGSTILTVSATSSARNSILELNGTRTTLNDYVAYVRMFNNGAATPVADIAAIRGSSDTTGSLTLSTSNEERLRIDSAGNVGIGTASPGAKLHNYSTATSNVFISGYGTAAQNDWGGEHAFFVNANNGIIIGKANAQNDTNRLYTFYNDAAGNAEQYIYNTSNTATIKLDSAGDTYFNGGNVGIGTTAPNGDLQFSNSANTRKIVLYEGANNDYQFYGFGVETATLIYSTYTNTDDHVFVSGASSTTRNELMRIEGGGNVGIGTTAPAAKLEVIGSIRNKNASANDNYSQLSTTESTLTISTYSVNTGSYPAPIIFSPNLSERMRITDAGNVGIGTTNPTGKLHIAQSNSGGVAAILLSEDESTIQGPAANTQIRMGSNLVLGASNIMTFGTNGSERMRITSDGNVGIGVTPSAWSVVTPTLQIGAGGAFIGGQGSANVVRVGVNTYYDGSVWRYINTGSASWFETASGAFGWFNAASGTAGGVASIGNLMTLTAGGNLGIGTTSPNAKLEVNGSAKIDTWEIDSYAVNNAWLAENVYFDGSDFRYRANGYAMLLYSDAGSGFQLRMSTGTGVAGDVISTATNLSIKPNGNVQIGTTTDSGYKLDVVGQSRFGSGSKAIVGTDGTYSSYSTIGFGGTTNGYNRVFGFDGTSDGLYLAAATGHGIYFRVNGSGSDSMFINSSGNVGIGTTAPPVKLRVQSSGSTFTTPDNNDVATISIYNSNNSSATAHAIISMRTQVSGGSPFISFDVENEAGYSVGMDNASNQFRIAYGWNSLTAHPGLVLTQATSPNVLIGTTTDAGYKLYVVGTGTSTNLGVVGNIRAGGTGTSGGEIIASGALGNGNYVSLRHDDTNGYITVTRTVYDGHLILQPYGNVGIGTTSPDAKLVVTGDSTGTAKIGGISIAGNYTGISLNGTLSLSNYNLLSAPNDASLFINRPTGNAIRFRESNSEQVTIATGGNVGIGTTSPGEKLSIGDTGNVGMSITDGTHTQYVASIATANAYGTGSTVGQLYLRGYDGIGFSGNQGGATHMTLLTGGNVGIGTTSPAYKLDVDSGSGQIAARFYNSSNVSTLVYIGDTGNSDFSDLILQSNSGTGEIFKNGTAYSGYGGTLSLNIYNSNGAIAFHPNGIANAMFINTSGNVGIGTTAPVTKLQVASASNAVDVLRIGNTAGDLGSVQGVTHLAINHFNAGTNPSTRITAYQDSTSGWPGGMYFSTRSLNTDSAPLERMRITSAGNIGIGTTSPQYLLDVNGDAQINAQGTGPAYAYVPDGEFGLDSLLTSGSENVALGKPDVWLRIHVDGVAFVFPGYQES